MDVSFPQLKQDYKVFVCCITFNHSKYIEDALKGFVMQKTDFPFVCVIVDDCSTDGEQEVIKTFLQRECKMEDAEYYDNEKAVIIVASHQKNVNCTMVVYFLKVNHYSQKISKWGYFTPWREKCQYEAICEGDDFWINSMKLQKQVDFMDTHPDYGLCFTDFDLVDGKRNHKNVVKEDGNYWPTIIERGVQIGTATVLYRTNIYKILPKLYLGKKWLMSDYPKWIEFAHESKLKYLPDITAKYRVLDNSASHSDNIQKEIDFIKCGIQIRSFYSNYYHYNHVESKKSFYIKVMKLAFKHKDKKVAKDYLKLAYNDRAISLKLLLFYLGAKNDWVNDIIHLVLYRL